MFGLGRKEKKEKVLNKKRKISFSMGVKERIVDILSISIAFIAIAMVLVLLSHFAKDTKVNTKQNISPEFAKTLTYDRVLPEDTRIDGTDEVTFSAYFLYDIDGDGRKDQVNGTCNEIGSQATLYFAPQVTGRGELKDQKIEVKGKNFYFVSGNLINNLKPQALSGKDALEVTLDKIDGTLLKTLSGTIRSGNYTKEGGKNEAIGDNINNYSRDDNLVIFTATYVDGNGLEIPLRKEITLTVDWYGKLNTKIDNTFQVRNDEDKTITNQEASFRFEINTVETNKELLLSNNTVEADIPDMNGYEPTLVTVTNSNIDFTYDQTTRKLTIIRNSAVDNAGNIVTGISNSNNYIVKVTYPKEAYELYNGNEFELQVPVREYYLGYNNPGIEFDNPEMSNIAEETVRIIYDHVTNYQDTAQVMIGKFVGKPYSDYVVSKLKPMRIYTGVSNLETDDNYEVKWVYHRGSNEEFDGIITLRESITGELSVADEFVSDTQTESMEDFYNNIGIYFNNLEDILPEDGIINVYDEELETLLLSIDKTNFKTYVKSNPYYFSIPVKHIRVEVSDINLQRTLEVVSIKQINDRALTEAYREEDLRAIHTIKTYMAAKIGDRLVEETENHALYELPKSNATISLSNNLLTTQGSDEEIVMTINAEYNPMNSDIGWSDGIFAIKLPDEITRTDITKVESKTTGASILTYEYLEKEGGKFIKVYTDTLNPMAYTIEVSAILTPDPRVDDVDTAIELYAYNKNGVSYYFEAPDSFDINNDGNHEQGINLTSANIHIMSPNSLIGSQTISNFDDQNTVVTSPNVVDIPKGKDGEAEKTATISETITNKYLGNVSDIVLLGKIPFEGNKEVLKGEDLGSTFTVKMKEGGISLPPTLEGFAKVYYTENETPSRIIDEVSNGWVTKENVSDWTKVRSFLIDLGTTVLSPDVSYTFTYDISIPNDAEYNDVAYSTFTSYFALNTDQGLYRTQNSSAKIGLHVSDKFSLVLTKVQEGLSKAVPEAVYSITEIKNENGVESLGAASVGYTNISGEVTFSNLYVDKVYEIREIGAPTDYELNAEPIRITATINQAGEVEVNKLSGTIQGNITAFDMFNDHYAYMTVEDTPRARLILTKQVEGLGVPIYRAKFQINGDSVNRAFTTNAYGQIYVSGLKVGEEYTITETSAEGYYLSDPIVIKVTKDTDGYIVRQVGSTNENVKVLDMTELNSIPTIEMTITNKLIPTYDLKIKKVIEGTETPLEGAVFRLYKGSEKVDDYTTDALGMATIYSLYEYEPEENIDQTYTLSEIYTPSGFTKTQDIRFKVQKVNGELQFVEDASLGSLHLYNADTSQNIVTLTVENSPSFRLIKEDDETNERLPGAKFTIYDATTDEPARNSKNEILGTREILNGVEYYVLTTDQYGEIIPDLPEGLYRLVEVKASDDKYDISNNEYYFKIGDLQDSNPDHIYVDHDGELIIKNKIKNLKVTTDIIEIDNVKGGTITGEDEDPFETIRYGENAVNSIEMRPNAGYEIISITVNGEEWDYEPEADGSYTMLPATNVTEDMHIEVTFCLSSNKITINKLDSVTHEPLKGAIFTIDSTDTNNPYHVEITSNSKGKAIWQIPFGSYTLTETKAPTGYKLDSEPKPIEFTEDGNHEFTVEDEETAKVIVHHYLKDTTEPVSEDELVEGDIGEEYYTYPILDLEEYDLEMDGEGHYILPDNSSGLFTHEIQEVTYYYVVRTIPLTVHHYLEGTATRVWLKDGNQAEDVITYGQEGASYTTSPIEDALLSDEYELEYVPSNNTGTFVKPGVEVTYTYQKVSRDVEIFAYDIDKEEGNNAISGVIAKVYKYDGGTEGDLVCELTTDTDGKVIQRLEIGDYIVKQISAPNGYITNNPDHVINISKANDIIKVNLENEKGPGEVTVHHYIEKLDGTKTEEKVILDDGQEADDDLIVGKIDSIYISEPKTNLNSKYKLSFIPDNASGIIEQEPITVTYYYKEQPGKVIVHHYLVGTEDPVPLADGTLAEDVILEGFVGETYTAEPADISDKYEIVSAPDNASDVFAPGETELTYYYKKKASSVLVHYYIEGTTDKVPKKGGGVVEDILIEGEVDEEYTTQATGDNVVTYVLVEEPDNKTGTMGLTQTEVIYYYRLRQYPYTVKYLEKGTSNIIKPSKNGEGKSLGDIVEAQSEVITIYGYSYDSASVPSITITENEEQNVLELYYTRKTGTVISHFYEEGTTVKVADDIQISGYVNDPYHTVESTSIPAKYELAGEPENKNGVYKEETVDVNYYYQKKQVKVLVHHLEDPATNGGKYVQLIPDEELFFRVDSTYETNPSSDVPNKYEVVESKLPSNATGTMGMTPIEVTYYYQLKTTRVNIRYIDRFNNQSLVAVDTISGKVDSPYSVSAKTIPGFTLTSEESTIEGVFEANTKTITFEYAKNILITANYINDKTDEIITTLTDNSKKQGDTYKVPAIDIDDYIVSYEPSNSQGTLGHDDITVDFMYTPVSRGVIEKHVDVNSGDVLFNKVHLGEYGDPYETEPRTFEGYDLVDTMLPENPTGFMREGVTTITYYYVRQAKITVLYQEKYSGRELLNPDGSSTSEIIEGHEGDAYNTTLKMFDGFELDKIPENASGYMPGGDTTIKYLYKERSGGVVIKHIDIRTGEAIVPDERKDGFVGEDYVIELLPENAYELVDSTGSREGKFEKQEKTITFYYKKISTVIIRYIDVDTGEDILLPDGTSSRIVIKQYFGDDYDSEVLFFNGYLLVEEPEKKSGISEQEVVTVTYQYRKLRFNFEIVGAIKSIIIDGKEEDVYDDIAKVEFGKTNVKNHQVRIKYIILVYNDSEIEADAVIKHTIPAGLYADPSLNPEWTITGNTATIETDTMLPDDIREYEIVVDWEPSADNVGVKSSSTEILVTNNKYDFEELYDDDNMFETEVIFAVSTGARNYVIIASMLLAIMIGIYFKVKNKNKKIC